MVLRWGKAIRHILGKIPVVIQAGVLLVGTIGGAVRISAGRLVTGKGLGSLAVFWAREYANYITGAIRPVEGDCLGK